MNERRSTQSTARSGREPRWREPRRQRHTWGNVPSRGDRRRTAQAGFTLVELLTSMTILVVMMVVLRSRLLQLLLERGKVLLCPAKIAILQILLQRAEGLLDGVGAVRTGAAWSRLRRRESRRESSEVLLGLGEISRLQILTQLRELVLDLLDRAVLVALALGALTLTILRFEKFKKVVARNS